MGIQIINPVSGGAADPSQITSTSKPTTRADGSALQQGDRWYNPSTGVDGFWNGTYWLSSFILSCSALGRDAGYTGGTSTDSAAIDNSSPIFVFKATVTYSVTVNQDSGNYWNIDTNVQRASASTTLTTTVNTQGQSALANSTLRVSKDLPVGTNYWAANTINNFSMGFGAVGTAGTIYLGATIYWRQVL